MQYAYRKARSAKTAFGRFFGWMKELLKWYLVVFFRREGKTHLGEGEGPEVLLKLCLLDFSGKGANTFEEAAPDSP